MGSLKGRQDFVGGSEPGLTQSSGGDKAWVAKSVLSLRSTDVFLLAPCLSPKPKFRSPSDDGTGGLGDEGQLSPGVLVRCASGPPPRTPRPGPPPVTRSPHLTAHSGNRMSWGGGWARVRGLRLITSNPSQNPHSGTQLPRSLTSPHCCPLRKKR